MSSTSRFINATLTCASLLHAGTAAAAVTEIEGAAGGGLVPWAQLTAGQPSASFTYVDSGDYTLTSLAAQTSFADRVELSYARQSFDTAGVGLGYINVDVLGAKVKLLAMDDSTPAVALGIQYKRTDAAETFLQSVGARDSGTDAYLAVMKVFQIGARNVLLNGTLRATKANQIGILGFGATDHDNYTFHPEVSAGVFVNDNTVLGAEYRDKPDNITGLKEDAWANVWIAYFPSKNLSWVVAYADLGDVAAEANPGAAGKDQRGLYLQFQTNF